MYKRSILYDQRFFQLQKKIVYHDMKGNKIIELNQNQTRKQEYKIAGAEKIITVIGISIICICVLVKIHPKKGCFTPEAMLFQYSTLPFSTTSSKHNPMQHITYFVYRNPQHT
jgi:hypothetical protein